MTIMISRKELNWTEVDKILENAISEDIGDGDKTTIALFDPEAMSEAVIVARDNGVLAGIDIASAVFEKLGGTMKWTRKLSDGDSLKNGDILAQFEGTSRQILSGERIALNLIQRLSGIATSTSRYVQQVRGLDVRIVDTRKTTPGIRALEKYAVVVGGGYNHRMGLYDGIMIKDNHIMAAGSIKRAVSLTRSVYGGRYRIEVETRNLDQVAEALESGADIIMLDNMETSDMKEAVRMIGKRALVEASGGITLDTVRSVAETGVDIISVGAITHSVRSLDVSLDMESLRATGR